MLLGLREHRHETYYGVGPEFPNTSFFTHSRVSFLLFCTHVCSCEQALSFDAKNILPLLIAVSKASPNWSTLFPLFHSEKIRGSAEERGMKKTTKFLNFWKF